MVNVHNSSLQTFQNRSNRVSKSHPTGGHLTYSVDREGGMLWAVSQAAPLRRVVAALAWF